MEEVIEGVNKAELIKIDPDEKLDNLAIIEKEPYNLSFLRNDIYETNNLLHILKLMITNNPEFINIQNKLSIKISSKIDEDVKNIIFLIIEKDGHIFDLIEASLKKIVADDKIDAKDIPDILICVQKLYELIYKFKSSKLNSQKRCEICATLVKMIVHILVEERIIKVDEIKKVAFLSSTDNLVDSAITLIGLSSVIKPKGCLKKLFGKK